jgi:hypothetical protein
MTYSGNRSAVLSSPVTGSDRFPPLRGREPGTSHVTGSGNHWGTSREPVSDGELAARAMRVMHAARRGPVVTADGQTLARWTVEALERQREAGE